MLPKSRRAAWIQGVVLVVAVVAIAATLFTRLQRPFERDTLAIPVGELRSQAAEAALLSTQVPLDHLAPAFVRFHARQLGHDVERVRGDLAGKPAVGALEPLRREALSLASALQSRIDGLARDAHLDRAGDSGFHALAQRFDDLDTRIDPEG